ncbi:MAG: hypothetical protein JEZ12_10460 [Desulfobacterium sp.]|nr:hypothetical protein [Desulfobacterium sp.]
MKEKMIFHRTIQNIKALARLDAFSRDESNRRKQFNALVLFGLPTMGAYGIYNLLNADYFDCWFIFLSAAGIMIGWLLARRLDDPGPVYHVNTFLFSLLALAMMISGGEGGSKLLWMYNFPLISYFFFGPVAGSVWLCVILISILVVLWPPFGLFITYPYPLEMKLRFLSTFLIFSGVICWVEYLKTSYLAKIKHKTLRLEQEIASRRTAEAAREKTICELQLALDEIKTLSGLVPICANCKKIRDDKGFWNGLEPYIEQRSTVSFTHGMCPECEDELYGEQGWYIRRKKEQKAKQVAKA